MDNRAKMYKLFSNEFSKEKYVDFNKILTQFGINIMDEITLLLTEVQTLENQYNIENLNRRVILEQLCLKTKTLRELIKIVKGKASSSEKKYYELRERNNNMRFHNHNTFNNLLLGVSNLNGNEYEMKQIGLSQFGSISRRHGDKEYCNIVGNFTIIAPVKCLSELIQNNQQSYTEANSNLDTLIKNKESFAFLWDHFYSYSRECYKKNLTLSFGADEMQFIIQNNSPMVVALKKILLYSQKYGTDFDGVIIEDLIDRVSQEKVSSKQKILTRDQGIYKIITGIK